MKLTQVLATGLSALGFFAGTARGSVLPYASASSALIVEDVQDVTSQSSDLRNVAIGITPSTIFKTGRETVNGLKRIAEDLTADLNKWKNIQGAPFTDPADAKPICAGFRAFVKAHQELLNVIIGKRQAFSNTPLLAEMAAVVRADEAVIDAVAFYLIDAVPPCNGDVQKDLGSIELTLRNAGDAYASPYLITTGVQVLKEYL